MPRYIDADKLQEAFKELHGGKRSLLIDTEPTADVVEVVRCKDCKHNFTKSWNQGKRDNPICHFTDFRRPNEFYCSFGERAEDE